LVAALLRINASQEASMAKRSRSASRCRFFNVVGRVSRHEIVRKRAARPHRFLTRLGDLR
jgi:hypothetical protein